MLQRHPGAFHHVTVAAVGHDPGINSVPIVLRDRLSVPHPGRRTNLESTVAASSAPNSLSPAPVAGAGG